MCYRYEASSVEFVSTASPCIEAIYRVFDPCIEIGYIVCDPVLYSKEQ